MPEFDISEEMVSRKLEALIPGKSPGPDKIHPRMLKQFARYFAHPLRIIFRESLVTGTMPEDCKNSTVILIYKKNSHCLAKNYRTVSLTSVVCKFLEFLIKTRLLEHVLDNMCIHPDQHVFLPRISCITSLLTEPILLTTESKLMISI